jgi:hypothetical protein
MNNSLPPDAANPNPAGESPQPRYLPTPEAAEFLRVSASYLEKLRVTGGGPRFLKLSGGKVLYKLDELIAWVEVEEVPPHGRGRGAEAAQEG